MDKSFNLPRSMTPREIVSELDKYIVGQNKAKSAVAIALRNRWRRSQVSDPLRQEITPKNILMIGPTGVGKTEIARRLAKLVNAPFIKVEATRFTEVGYVGRDVETIIRDLAEVAVKNARELAIKSVQNRGLEAANERILDILLPTGRSNSFFSDSIESSEENATRSKFRKKLLAGELDEKEIEIEVDNPAMQAEIFAPPGMEELTNQIQGMFQNLGSGRKKNRKLLIKEAIKILSETEASKLINDEEVKINALYNVEQNGIVFLDEIDKIAGREQSGSSADVSRQGVQRDLLPLVEGTTVSTKYGMIKTDHVLFIASGAFHLAKPSDLIPELQGRFPIRVELDSLSIADFKCILTQTDACLTKQYQSLLATEGVELNFTENGICKLAEIAFRVNEKTENIGARRLYTVMEKLLEEISFRAGDGGEKYFDIDEQYVDQRLSELAGDEDLSRYVL